MLEETIYSISNHFIQLIVFLGVVLLLGLIIYIMVSNFDIHKKRIRYCGLLTGLNQKQTLTLCVIFMRTFCIIYAVSVYTKNILFNLILILMIDLIYILLTPKKVIFESINLIAQLILIYLINILRTYQLEISNDMYVGQVATILSVFMVLYTIYFFLKNFEELIRKKQKGKRKHEKR